MPVDVRPYGSWASPVPSSLVAAGDMRIEQVSLDGEDVYWIEGRPLEGGRNVIVRRMADGSTVDVTPPPFNARTRVHEYGGGAYLVSGGEVFFSNMADQRLYRQRSGGQPEPLTPPGPWRYADVVLDARRARLICVLEDHGVPGLQPRNLLATVALQADATPRDLVSGNDFYSSPRLSADGTRLAWLTWNHPNMPWDGSELWVGRVAADGTLADAQFVAGGPDESIVQPEWSPDGALYFVSDRTGWWNLYRWREGGLVEALHTMEAEFGRPQWVFGMSSYAFVSPYEIVCAYCEQGVWRLARLDTASGEFEPIDTPFTDIDEVRGGPGFAVFRAASPMTPRQIVRLDVDTLALRPLRPAPPLAIDAADVSLPQAIAYPTEGGAMAYAYYYPPCNRRFVAPEGELPPLIVRSHGGPTGAATATFSWAIQFWTSRGFGLVDVNYRGSTGYGRAYREQLKGQWGIADVEDCVHAARYLAAQGKVDPQRFIIRGSSAGGYTTLCALTSRSEFRAGASYYGVGDLEALARDTHKFESRYLDRLIAPYPEGRALYVERSPIHHTDQLACPMILFQGLEDAVVPPEQAEQMLQALREKRLPVAYVPFAGEQHGFRRAENIQRSLEAELYFYGRVFGFTPADEIEPVEIENLG